MKRAVTVVVVMAALLVGAPWVIGNVAEDRVDRTLERLVESAPYLGIVDRSYTRGWFRSEQEVTFELLGGTRPAGATARFTVHNEILHGPLLGFSGIGLARVNSMVVLDPKIRRQIAARFGTEDPIEISTRVGFLGGGKTTLSSEARELELDDGGTIAWGKLAVDVGWSADFDSIDVKGVWPRFEARDRSSKSVVRFEDAMLDLSSQRLKGHLYRTDAEFSLANLAFDDGEPTPTQFKKLGFVIDTSEDGDFTSVALRLGSNGISGGEFAVRGIEFTATHYDLTLRHLHTETLARISNAIAESYRQPGAAARLDEDLLALLGHDPELRIDRFGFETKDGAAYLTGVIRIKGATDKDLRMGALSLIARLDADLRFEAPRKVIEGLPGGGDALAGAVDGGYAELQAGNVVSHLEFHAGQLEINGKVSGIPGLGDPSAKEGPGPE